jgi:hypothetical protein
MVDVKQSSSGGTLRSTMTEPYAAIEAGTARGKVVLEGSRLEDPADNA